MAGIEPDPVLSIHEVSTVMELIQLLRNGADINQLKDFSETPMHSAFRHETERGLIQQMVLNGANVNAKDAWGMTPLFYAVTRHVSDRETIEFLLEHGADIKSGKRSNDRLLDNVVTHNRECIELVIKYKFLRNFPKVQRFKINVLYENKRNFYKQYKKIVELNLIPASYEALSDYLDACATEFLQMRSSRIHGSITFEHFLTNKNPLQTDSRSSFHVMQQILQDLCLGKYPIYEDLIINKIDRKDLLRMLDARIEKHQTKCKTPTLKQKVFLNTDLMRIIKQYLTGYELFTLIMVYIID
ncbi:ANK_REP_REGION domain-containing protein [Trichonephila inaurata madagascariensis]|uniref:ANK_REP_REGION domain-containing protein n=1 Tax=Trichonephila inaurata madagascariensis TaxID=2747483 RepID=A0A8X6XWQ3_9ARAC|nr:ANK_REP_REGION domain-containing protein [Trichonephila inaurata madagascariensis]